MTPDQFDLAWETTGLECIPYPLSVRQSARTESERAAQLPQLRAWCDENVDPDFEVALRVLAKPSIRIEVFGFQGADDARPVRILGAAVGHTAAVVVQDPGAAPDIGNTLMISLAQRSSMTERIASGLPKCDGGKQDRRTAPLREVRRDSKDIVMVSPVRKSAAGQVRRMLNSPRDGIGQILVTTHVDEGVHRTPHVLSWIDVTGDGRYIVRTRDDVDIIPATHDMVVDQLRRVVKEAL